MKPCTPGQFAVNSSLNKVFVVLLFVSAVHRFSELWNFSQLFLALQTLPFVFLAVDSWPNSPQGLN